MNHVIVLLFQSMSHISYCCRHVITTQRCTKHIIFGYHHLWAKYIRKKKTTLTLSRNWATALSFLARDVITKRLSSSFFVTVYTLWRTTLLAGSKSTEFIGIAFTTAVNKLATSATLGIVIPAQCRARTRSGISLHGAYIRQFYCKSSSITDRVVEERLKERLEVIFVANEFWISPTHLQECYSFSTYVPFMCRESNLIDYRGCFYYNIFFNQKYYYVPRYLNLFRFYLTDFFYIT